ncbi:DNA-binding transcriptional activator of the SARP family [Actinokineospora alba]|uniref:DNA-binding transcriptional activator of the SARP family n=1 Tax=Actinokineospora alba TaxID=504798 RepID=A0A1H0V5L6_9PSEU|nr:BTAD domain-containing putative transcriptional regulator [Actinokineospora alba]SDH63463.1 DNA-binding transcriptional activator of the SARP family [Actinokineospora alba]SDP73737.1 DNA-binding transcriptional activator of the SARP family [Actinokineospora alba]
MVTTFRLLGEIEATVNGEPADLGHARQRSVLAALLVEPNRPVSTGALTDRVWGDRVPSSAQSSVHSYVSRLRKALAGADDVSLSRQSGGYVVRVDPEKVDLHEFRALVAAAKDANAESRLERALGLWRGRPFGDLETPWLDRVRDELERERFAAELDHNDIRLRGDGHGSLLARLSTLSAAHPTDERVAGQLMLALWKSGRQADALTHFDRLRRRLSEELGIDPGKPLRDLHQRILLADSKPDPPARQAPAQLPADAAHFTGRAADLDELARAVRDHDSSRVTICAIEGTPGVGKTALAVRFAHRGADAFPDGQLFLNLRGYGLGSLISPDAALATLLHGVGVAGAHIPAGLDARAALWRTQTAGRKLLILLDNAADSTQVRPLLPGPGSVVIVTSRARLRGLVVREGAHQLRLDRMPTDDALEMLRSIVGPGRVAEARTEARKILDVCARLPLAIRILGERAGFDPELGLTGLLDELGDETGRLAAFDLEDDEDSDLRSVFLHSYKALGERPARLFRLLGAQHVADFTAASAAAVGGITEVGAAAQLDELVARHLVEQPNPGRYQFHDLMRDFARTLARETDAPDAIQVSTRRLLGYYLSGLTNAGTRMNSNKPPLTLPYPTDVLDTPFSGLE